MDSSQNKDFVPQFSDFSKVQNQKGIKQNQNLNYTKPSFLRILNRSSQISQLNLPKGQERIQTANIASNRNSNLPFRRHGQLCRATSLDSGTTNNYFNQQVGVPLFDTEKLRVGSFLTQLKQQNQIRQPMNPQSFTRPKWIPPNFYHSNIPISNGHINQQTFPNQMFQQQQQNNLKGETTIAQQTKLFSTINLNNQRQNPKQNYFDTTRNKIRNNQENQQVLEQGVQTKPQKENKQNENQKLLKNLNLEQKQNIGANLVPKTSPQTKTKTIKKQKTKTKERRLVRSRSIEQKFQSTSPFLRKRRIEGNEQINNKVKEKTQVKKNKINSSIVENGKDLFKLLTGQLWVISGGASQKVLTPYTNQFAIKIGEVLGASEKELSIIKSQLKYLLSNSRRTLTEFVLEILVGVLSLVHLDNSYFLCNQFWEILKDIVHLNNNKQQQQQQQEQTILKEEEGEKKKEEKEKKRKTRKRKRKNHWE
ncbi:hypothetical protein M0813_03485 [Anaeramoeba flamelloides]|uniref:Uncharacterized protein n=1 Tax=Anaeramoeba flamelloides TaxID=1746091 RepID=A0ABQ8XZ08_9EUKA|nr:hypothetical protein M0813_03485 [Anaeramoeba flamelloides]